MHKAGLITRLNELAQSILILLHEARCSLGNNNAVEWQSLSLTRFNLLRALNEFVLYKENAILTPIICAGDVASAKQAAILGKQNCQVQQSYDDFVQRWNLIRATFHITSYKREASEIADMIESQVNKDIIELSKLLSCVVTAPHPMFE